MVILAVSLAALIWVRGIRCQTSSLDVAVGGVRPASVASLVLLRAVNQLLLRKRNKLLVGVKVVLFDSKNSAESPA